MNDYVTEDEQVERIKKWWSDNGSSVIFGLVIGIGGLAGWRYWVDYRNNVNAEASMHFDSMVQAVEKHNSKTAIDEAMNIIDDYNSTSYAELARLTLAKVYVDEKEFDKAAQQLQSILDSKPEQPMEMLTRERLAAVQLQMGKFDEALTTLNVEFPKQFAAAFEELKGDILAAKGDINAARAAYQSAKLAQPAPANPQFLQQKMDDLGVAAEMNS
jgi:predicted negative regulator of RcsB-dependent stress response